MSDFYCPVLVCTFSIIIGSGMLYPRDLTEALLTSGSWILYLQFSHIVPEYG